MLMEAYRQSITSSGPYNGFTKGEKIVSFNYCGAAAVLFGTLMIHAKQDMEPTTLRKLLQMRHL